MNEKLFIGRAFDSTNAEENANLLCSNWLAANNVVVKKRSIESNAFDQSVGQWLCRLRLVYSEN